MATIGRLAARFGLSRSTLMYYERIGLLVPGGRARGEYRHYTDEDARRLSRIMDLRAAGLPLADIGRILDGDSAGDGSGSDLACALEKRLHQLRREMDALREQQGLIAGMLGRPELTANAGPMTKERWTSLLRAAGFSEEDMNQWHIRFEQSAPQEHEQFLRALSIPEDEIKGIRTMSVAPPKEDEG